MDPLELKTSRLYKVWKGNNKFLCGGRAVFGPDAASLFLTTFLIGAPAIIFLINLLLKIGKHGHGFYNPILIARIVLTVMDFTFLFLTSGRDPSIICRNSQPPESDEPIDMNTPSMEWVNNKIGEVRLLRIKDVIVKIQTRSHLKGVMVSKS